MASNVPQRPRRQFPAPTYGSPQFSGPLPASTAPPQGGYPSAPPTAPKTNGLAILALVTSFIFPIIVPLVAGIIAVRQINASNGAQKGKGMAIWGIIVGAAIPVFFFFGIAGS
ncbi:MAG: DUF4190 domain-containing protein [Thermomicrobiales bacterium]